MTFQLGPWFTFRLDTYFLSRLRRALQTCGALNPCTPTFEEVPLQSQTPWEERGRGHGVDHVCLELKTRLLYPLLLLLRFGPKVRGDIREGLWVLAQSRSTRASGDPRPKDLTGTTPTPSHRSLTSKK